MAMTFAGHKMSISTVTSKKAGSIYGALAFFASISRGQINNSWNTGQKLGVFFVANPLRLITGSNAGYTAIFGPASGVPSITPSFSVGKAFNIWTYLGIALSIYGFLPFNLPHQAAARNIGPPIAIGGAIGGGFDAPLGTPSPGQGTGPLTTTTYNPSSTAQGVLNF